MISRVAEWTSMTVEEIHTRIFGKTAIASGFIADAFRSPAVYGLPRP
jgi:hypothetical protein